MEEPERNGEQYGPRPDADNEVAPAGVWVLVLFDERVRLAVRLDGERGGGDPHPVRQSGGVAVESDRAAARAFDGRQVLLQLSVIAFGNGERGRLVRRRLESQARSAPEA